MKKNYKLPREGVALRGAENIDAEAVDADTEGHRAPALPRFPGTGGDAFPRRPSSGGEVVDEVINDDVEGHQAPPALPRFPGTGGDAFPRRPSSGGEVVNDVVGDEYDVEGHVR